jgi:hypothetical protein
VLPGPADSGYDPALALRAEQTERQANGLSAAAVGATSELSIADAAARETITSWILSGSPEVESEALVSSWAKVAGAYGGVSIAADAWRYGALREEGAPCAEVEAAAVRLDQALEALQLAMEITGTEGVIARGFARNDLPGDGQSETTPLFDESGNPLPEEKNNGIWRADNSGKYPTYSWEDSVSRDQLIGWTAGMAAAWEVIREDPRFSEEQRQRLAAASRALLQSLMTVQESGYDLEIRDADGRMTYHGILHHESVDRYYIPGAKNALNAALSLGIVGGLVFAADDPAITDWFLDDLIAARDLPGIVRDESRQIKLGYESNYSNYNMVYIGGMVASRYLCDEGAREAVNTGLIDLYQGESRDPIEQDQALYDLAFAMATGGISVWGGGEPEGVAMEKVNRILTEFPDPPFWAQPVENCDAEEIAAKSCTLTDGTVVELADETVAEQPIPMRARPPSNYFWRTNPYEFNASGSEEALYPAVDWRIVYQAGRWSQR